MLIGLGAKIISIGFGFTRSKAKVTMLLFGKNGFHYFFFITSYHRDMIFHVLIDLGKDMAPIDFEFTRLKVKNTWVTCKK